MLRTATRLARRPPNSLVVANTRPSSSAAVHDDHHHHEQDDTVYPPQGFGAPIWRKTLVCTIGAVIFYEYLGVPADNEKPWVPATEVTSAGSSSSLDLASARAAKEDTLLKDRHLVRTATRPPMYRSRTNPNDAFDHVSPYSNAVGQKVEWNGVRKGPIIPGLAEARARSTSSPSS
ncbi:hypothetical protein R3P38DRAFT_2840553 [Favolaschia claudopus]|uniref:Uncharacterized protein n=1 Tax=Favolaschia claudopus TaxID=2862362 RepID=A0AAW0DZG3_9AGAR